MHSFTERTMALAGELTPEEFAAKLIKDTDIALAEVGIDVTTERGAAIRNWVVSGIEAACEFFDDDPEVALDYIRGSIERRKADRQQRVVDDGQGKNAAS